MAGETVSAFAGIHDQDVFSGATKLQGGGKAGIAAADDDDVEFHDAPIVQGMRRERRSFS